MTEEQVEKQPSSFLPSEFRQFPSVWSGFNGKTPTPTLYLNVGQGMGGWVCVVGVGLMSLFCHLTSRGKKKSRCLHGSVLRRD